MRDYLKMTVFLSFILFLLYFWSIYSIDFRDIDKNSYMVENQVLDETITISLKFPEDKGDYYGAAEPPVQCGGSSAILRFYFTSI